uniref:Orf116a n=1 Tax=Batis maritima TaxID=4436 RepID=A0A068BE91_BATMA|nr:orf116a [Batis maritima]AIC83381.1 orf116a [Batis maritima]
MQELTKYLSSTPCNELLPSKEIQPQLTEKGNRRKPSRREKNYNFHSIIPRRINSLAVSPKGNDSLQEALKVDRCRSMGLAYHCNSTCFYSPLLALKRYSWLENSLGLEPLLLLALD